MKICRVCKHKRPDNAFYTRKTNHDGLRTECKRCHSAIGKSNYIKNKKRIDKKILQGHLRRSYGISLDNWNELFVRQNGVCAICKKPETRFSNKSRTTQRLCVDHDHNTNQVRGLLCHRCNSTIGLMEENTDRLSGILEYLNKWRAVAEQDLCYLVDAADKA